MFFTLLSTAQVVDKAYIDNQIRKKFPESNVDSVRVYIVNGKYLISFDTLALNNKLNKIAKNEIIFLYYSKAKTCGYQPGHGTIYVSSGEQSVAFKKALFKKLQQRQKKAKKSN